MGKKRNLQNALTEEELLYIEEKKNGGVERPMSFKDEIKFMSSMKVDIKCKNEKQKEFLNQLKDKNKQLVIGSGSAGCGKSYISLAYALKALKDGDYSRIIMVIPTIPAGGKELNLGFLKGDLEQKSEPYKQADNQTVTKILNNSNTLDASETARTLVYGGYIQYEFVNFLLGKTLDNAIILVNEAEQYTKENMRLILTRIGENSKFVITGDCKQVNRNEILNKKEECGLSYIANNLSVLDEVAVTEFTDDDIVRNPLIAKILKIMDN